VANIFPRRDRQDGSDRERERAEGFPVESCERVTRGNFRWGKCAPNKKNKTNFPWLWRAKCDKYIKIRQKSHLNQCVRCKVNINIGRLAAACDKKVRSGSKEWWCTAPHDVPCQPTNSHHPPPTAQRAGRQTVAERRRFPTSYCTLRYFRFIFFSIPGRRFLPLKCRVFRLAVAGVELPLQWVISQFLLNFLADIACWLWLWFLSPADSWSV